MGDLDTDADPVIIDSEEDEENVNLGLIEGQLSINQLKEIKKIFESAYKLGLRKSEFKQKVLDKFNVELTDDEYDVLFVKLDFNKDEHVSWDELVSYLSLELECKHKDPTKLNSIEDPIVGDPEFIPSGHRNAITRVIFCPAVRPDNTIDNEDGKYVTLSKDGLINFWTPDFEILRTFRDNSPNFTFRTTWVTSFECLPDVNIVVTSSTERELRFYDTTSKGFNLILMFVVMPFAVNHMHYHFTENPKEDSILICGDLGGNIRVMEYSSDNKGPFKRKIGVETAVYKWEQVVKGRLNKMNAFNVVNIHTDWVKEVSYYKLLGSIVSCSSSINALFIGDHRGAKPGHTFHFKRGVETFCLNEESPLVITGSLDCALRLWNPFITSKPVSILRGHHASIIKIFLQEEGRRIFSLDKERFVKVWDSATQTCIQTYTGFATDAVPTKDCCGFYNEYNHLLIVAGFVLGRITCGKLVDEVRSDGKTHSDKVSVVLFNRLFKLIVTCGMDSNIVVWDLWNNKTRNCIRMAHSVHSFGVEVPLPITSATFDPPNQLLLTGSRDGSIKIWDFNTGLCLRNMEVGKSQEVAKLIWLSSRILAVGWNCRVVEFPDSLTGKISGGKAWELRHTDDILCADYRPGQALATCTYNGDLIFWRLETGQSYKRFNVTYPTGLFKLEYIREKEEKKFDVESMTSKSSKGSYKGKKDKEKFNLKSLTWLKTQPTKRRTSSGVRELKPPTKILFAAKVEPHVQRFLAVYCLLFLRTREMLPDQATVLTALENGMVQAWSHHPSGGYITAFRAVHTERDYVGAMMTDPTDEFLFTGTTFGYIKIWLLKNYCLTADVKVDICIPKYRLQFPFMIKDRFLPRAKFALKQQPLPILLSSYRGHLKAVMSIEYIPECKILLSGSADTTARAWTLSGRYLGTLGQKKPWLKLKWGVDAEALNSSGDFRIPPDLKRTGSYSSLKVFKGAPPIVTKKYDVEVDLSLTAEEKKYGVYGKPLDKPHLGHYHEFPSRNSKRKKNPTVDESMMKIPVFTYLKITSWAPMNRPTTPKCITAVRNRENHSLELDEDV